MSIKFMARVWKEESLSSNQKLIMLSISDNANDEGVCYPSVDNIQKKTCLSRPTVIKIVKELESKNYLMIHKRARKKGGRYSNLYLVFPSETLENLDDEYREKFSQSKEALLYPQSKEALPQNDSQSKEALPKPSLTLFNHHLFKEMNSEEKELFLEYLKVRTKLKLVTTYSIQDRLLKKYFEFGRTIDILENAINSSWRDFYKPKQQYNPKQPKESLGDVARRLHENSNIEEAEVLHG